MKCTLLTPFDTIPEELSEIINTHLAVGAPFKGTLSTKVCFPCLLYYIALFVGSLGGGMALCLGETLPVYNGASPSDEPFEPLRMLTEAPC